MVGNQTEQVTNISEHNLRVHRSPNGFLWAPSSVWGAGVRNIGGLCSLLSWGFLSLWCRSQTQGIVSWHVLSIDSPTIYIPATQDPSQNLDVFLKAQWDYWMFVFRAGFDLSFGRFTLYVKQEFFHVLIGKYVQILFHTRVVVNAYNSARGRLRQEGGLVGLSTQ